METRKMTVSQWASILNNPRQRDTDAHAAKACKKHLKSPSPTHCKVSAARLPGGDLVKLDGHTRSLLWSDGRLACPAVVECDIYPVNSMDEAKELYTHFDSHDSVENSRDKLAGAFRESGIAPTSCLILSGGFTSAINKLFPDQTPIYKMVKPWKREIEELDAFGFSKNMKSGFILGSLVLLRVRGARITPFLNAVALDDGTKTQGGRDGVEAYLSYTKEMTGKSTGEKAVTDIAGALITCAEGYLAGRAFKRRPVITKFSEYLGKL